MAKDETLARVRELVAELCDVGSDKVRAESRLLGFGMDSVRILDLLMALEDAYGIDLPESDPDLAGVQTVGELAELVHSRRS